PAQSPEAPALALMSTFSQPGPGRRIPPMMAIPRARKQPQPTQGSARGARIGRAGFGALGSPALAFVLGGVGGGSTSGQLRVLQHPQGRRGWRGSLVLICLRELTRMWNLSGSPGLASLRTHDFTAGQSFPRLPQALGPGEQTPALFSRTDSSGSFHMGCGLGRLWTPRGTATLASPLHASLAPNKVRALTGRPQASGFLWLTGLPLRGARVPALQTGGGGHSVVWPAARPGTSLRSA
ncbi:unnamed protein product, partial [Rangifer tarandus platyrhynchus]